MSIRDEQYQSKCGRNYFVGNNILLSYGVGDHPRSFTTLGMYKMERFENRYFFIKLQMFVIYCICLNYF